MNKRTKSFLLSILTLSFIFSSCSNLANDLQKRKNQNLFNITIQETSNGTVTAAKSSGIKAGEEVILTVTAASGYELKNISVTNTQNKDVAVAAMEQGTSYKFTMPNSDVTVSAIFEKQGPIDISNPEDLSSSNGNTLYRIEHYQQDVDDLDSYTLYAIQKKRGSAGEKTEAVAQTYQGFNSLSFAQQTITADGSTVIEIYYNRKTITYTFDPNGGNWDGDTGIKTVTGVYGARIPLENPQKAGYNLTWDKTKPQTFEGVDLSFTASWTARTDTKYTVKTYEQKVEGGDNYTLLSTVERTGTTDTNTTVTANNKTGFDIFIEQNNINGDGSAVVYVYYNRKSYTITFDTNGGSPIPSQQVLYGAKVQLPLAPTKEGFRFWNWFSQSTFNSYFHPDVPITSDKILYAFWASNTITYSFHESVIKLPVGTNGTYGKTGEYVLFGDYPQTLKEETVIVDETVTIKMGDMTLYNGNDGYLYVKQDSKYFKVEPIKWRVLSKDSNGKAVLFAENIHNGYYWDLDQRGIGIFTNSELFDYLNSFFLDNAFTFNAQKKIAETLIIPDGFDQGSYYNWEEYTKIAKVYLLNYYEVFNEDNFDSPSSRERRPTNYAYSIINQFRWWLCTSCNSTSIKTGACIIDESGYRGLLDIRVRMGIVPALSIFIPEDD